MLFIEAEYKTVFFLQICINIVKFMTIQVVRSNRNGFFISFFESMTECKQVNREVCIKREITKQLEEVRKEMDSKG